MEQHTYTAESVEDSVALYALVGIHELESALGQREHYIANVWTPRLVQAAQDITIIDTLEA
jgi:hypothetical protein